MIKRKFGHNLMFNYLLLKPLDIKNIIKATTATTIMIPVAAPALNIPPTTAQLCKHVKNIAIIAIREFLVFI